MRRTILWAGGARTFTVGLSVILALMFWIAAMAAPANTPAAAQSAQTPKFLSLPFPRGENVTTGDREMNVQQGWLYSPDEGLHSGIDYVEGTIDSSSTWQHFPVVAAAAGEACADCAKGPGNKVLIKHDFGNGVILYTYYGHLNWIAPWIPSGNRNNTVEVQRGEQIGTAGSTGAAKPEWVHLHFGLTPPSFAWVDPYGLNSQRASYPNPNGTNGKLSGTNHYWSRNPAYYAPGLRKNLGGVELTGYCKSIGYKGVSLDGTTAYDWHCVTESGGRVGIDMTHACHWQHSTSQKALMKDFYDPSSWRCYGDPRR